jgi:SNF2 family DNA or RNA helicase
VLVTYVQKTKSYEHQKALLHNTMDLASYALFWEMGVAKTKPVIDTIGHLFESGEINGALVVAPKAVAPNWTNDEIPDHFGVEPDRYRVFLWNTDKANGKGYQEKLAEFLATPPDKLAILVMSYDAIMTERKKNTARGLLKGKEAAKKLLVGRRCMFVLDESARIKGPNTKRTKRVMSAGKYAPFRRIMTGTPVPNSPFDVYTQLKFLDPDVWKRMGCGTFAAFKAMFGVWIEHERKDSSQRFQQLVDYQNLAILNKVVDRMGERLLKDDVLDLPPKLYDKRTFDMTPEQKRIYGELKREFIIWLDNGDMITAPLAITRMLRLQQVTSGYCPTDDGGVLRITPNARLTCLMDLLEDVPHQAIVWAKFQDDIDQISEAIGHDNCVVYDGRVSQVDREVRRAAFKAGEVQYFVANPAAAGEGLTLHMAKTVVYYNSTYKLGDRLQSEDRAHRAGMDDRPVQYIDIIARGTIDAAILRALRTKVDLAAQVTGDRIRQWI